MKRLQDLKRLKELSDLILDQHLARLQACSMEKEQSLERLRNLAPKSTENLDKLALAKSLLRYEVWAEARRSEINIALARQTAALMEARKDAEYVFGRSMVLRRIAQEQKNRS